MEDRAAKKALETFPILFGERMGYDKTNLQQERRNAYEKGYHQAEEDLKVKAQFSSGWDGFYYGQGYQQAKKDLELSWEDIKTIDKLLNQCVDYSNPYQEVLKRFKDYKERKEQ